MKLMNYELKDKLENMVLDLQDTEDGDKYAFLTEGLYSAANLMLAAEQWELPLNEAISKVILLKRYPELKLLDNFDHVVATGVYIRHNMVVFEVSEELYRIIDKTKFITSQILSNYTDINPELFELLDFKSFNMISYKYGVILLRSVVTDEYIWNPNNFVIS